MDEEAGELACRFAAALAAKDRDELCDVLAADVDFHGMTPGRTWSAPSSAALVDDVLLGAWFEPTDRITDLVSVETHAVMDRTHLTYQLTVLNVDGLHLVEQTAYLTESAGRIDWMRLMCSGFRPVH
ncbi:hypothetical protein [Solicola sp. PLA-1-18]|uniref:hypothetical protein n=1 Tax=Solicola sp. PLA-1-18 TaxID=3380532 RepID=UPI003B78D081